MDLSTSSLRSYSTDRLNDMWYRAYRRNMSRLMKAIKSELDRRAS